MRTWKQVVSCLAVVIAALAVGSAPVYADLLNGGFESGAMLTSISGSDTWQPSTSIDLVGWAGDASAFGIGALSQVQVRNDGTASEGLGYLRLNSQSVWNLAVNDEAGNQVYTLFFVALAGDTLSFDYRKSVTESPYDQGTPDYGYWAGVTITPYDATTPIAVIDPASVGSWTTATWVAPLANAYYLRFATNAYWGAGATLDIDNVHLNSAPEPSTLVLLGIGAISLLGYVWWRRKRTA